MFGRLSVHEFDRLSTEQQFSEQHHQLQVQDNSIHHLKQQSHHSNQKNSFIQETDTKPQSHQGGHTKISKNQSFGYEMKDLVLFCIAKKWIIIICLLMVFVVSSTHLHPPNYLQVNEYVIYTTKYNKNNPSSNLLPSYTQQFSTNILNLIGYDVSASKIQIILPLSLHSPTNKLSLQTCLSSYSLNCISSNLIQTGSISLHLQHYVLTLINGYQQIFIQAKLDYILTIVIIARIMKQYQLGHSGTFGKLVLYLDDAMPKQHTTAIRMTLMQNNCLDSVDIIQETFPYLFVGKYFVNFDYVLVEQDLYNTNIFQKSVDFSMYYSTTTIIVVLPEGMSIFTEESTKIVSDSQCVLVKYSQNQVNKFKLIGMSEQKADDYQHSRYKFAIMVYMAFVKRSQQQITSQIVKFDANKFKQD